MKKKEVLVLTCKRCNEDFLYEYNGSGKKPDYCPDCRIEVTNELKQKYKDNKKIAKQENASEEKIEDTNFATRIADLFGELDTLRVNMCTLASEMNSYQSSYDKADQTFLHKIENIDTEDTVETQKLVKEWKNSRNNRRNLKDLLQILNSTIDSIPYKNRTNALPVLKGCGLKNFR